MTPKVIGIVEAAQMHASKFPNFTLANGRQLGLIDTVNEIIFVRIVVTDEGLRNCKFQKTGLKKLGDNGRNVHLTLLTRAGLEDFTIERNDFPAEEYDQLRARRARHDDDHILGYTGRGNPARLTMRTNYAIHEHNRTLRNRSAVANSTVA